MKISESQVRAAEKVASDVFDGSLSVTDGSELLAEDHGLNINSARDFINDYKCMMQGRLFQRAMSAPAIAYFLSRIRENRGDKHHALAVFAVEQHINYYEGIRGRTLRSLRAVVDEHRRNATPLQFTEQAEAFHEAVMESMSDSAIIRRQRLMTAPKILARVPVVTYAFIRNPDVVAEVLGRASGKCERCGHDAPFKRRKDDQPYLEVHHINPLALGGEDAVDNALALCPNCHRELHFGALPE